MAQLLLRCFVASRGAQLLLRCSNSLVALSLHFGTWRICGHGSAIAEKSTGMAQLLLRRSSASQELCLDSNFEQICRHGSATAEMFNDLLVPG
jgi:hypothetical protein